ncbi:AAA family ATPase, partial [Chromobacterium piscinae]|uniref:AAA family ATPase n=1 Tax=Chromobacterium piscinae TaxID=686831 RepID=UPI00320A1CD0
VLFIPASRAFFSIIQNFTFSLLENGSGLDAYIVDYGSACELSRYIGREDSRNKIEAAKYLTGAFKSLIQGEYSFEDGQHFIVKDGVQTSLTKASSAQQELVPMLWGLSVFALPTGESGVPRVCFIEEPEAHLFPDAQAKVMGVLSEMFNQHPLGCFITTHSPYCISTMNNFILAADLVESGKLSEEGAMKILGYGRPIKFEDVEAYYVNEGTVRSIKDAEYRLIVADELDAVSNHVDDVMTSLLEAGRD